MDVILASSSPRRAELLRQIGVRFAIHPANIDESQYPGEAVEIYVQRMAREKAQTVAQKALANDLPVLGADTTVVLDKRIFPKPADKTEAIATLRALSGRSHRVLSAIAVVAEDRTDFRLSETSVRFRDIKEQEYERYWSTGEAQGKAGAYAIQGLGAVFVEGITGSYSGVVGLPLMQTFELFERFNIACWNAR
ncbi:MAG: septum formation inhibitor Maf [Gammaproteobacteria bacterium]|nr:septum formation inhibitor Maf [Gammaproteobacteria bacterium]MBQ0838456.1 septum formation inhibitor Maf [Gammaproteobacteria bacterium]